MKNPTQDYLFAEYGPLISYSGLAKIFNRSTQGLRVSLCDDSEFSSALNTAKRKYGRLVFFDSVIVAKIIDDDRWKCKRNPNV